MQTKDVHDISARRQAANAIPFPAIKMKSSLKLNFICLLSSATTPPRTMQDSHNRTSNDNKHIHKARIGTIGTRSALAGGLISTRSICTRTTTLGLVVRWDRLQGGCCRPLGHLSHLPIAMLLQGKV